jgi:hypothetical protein
MMENLSRGDGGKVCHAGGGRHPGSLQAQMQTRLWISACAGMTEEKNRAPVDECGISRPETMEFAK